MTLRAIVVDDEPLARRRLSALLKGEPRVEVVAECEDGGAAHDAVRRLAPDLLFLDVQMPGLDGFDVIELLAAGPCPAVIFVTAFDHYAMRAFDVHAVDYLLKPFARARLEAAVTRAAALGGQTNSSARLQALVETVREREPLRRFLIKTAGRAHAVRVEDVESIEAADHYVELRTARGSHLLRDALARIEPRLDPSRFVRVHRSTIVNLDRVGELEPAAHGECTVRLESGRRLRCSRTYAPALKRALAR